MRPGLCSIAVLLAALALVRCITGNAPATPDVNASLPESFIALEAATYTQGSPSGASFDYQPVPPHETPPRTVTLGPFAICKYETTFGLFASAMQYALDRELITIDSAATLRLAADDSFPLAQIRPGSPESRLSFDSNSAVLLVDSGYENHPVWS
ncbi:MAG: hypothetical protein GF350_00240, partial [Chitinivibrionales bacterium]|nr:hypothetical protein [Chitinivibrionales bacterium]